MKSFGQSATSDSSGTGVEEGALRLRPRGIVVNFSREQKGYPKKLGGEIGSIFPYRAVR